MQRHAAVLRGAAVAAAALALSGPTAAAQTVAPPGNSGVDQYLEVVPAAGGDARPSGERRVLPRTVSGGLASQGAAGRRAQRVIEQTAPAPVRAKPRKREREEKEIAPAPRPDSTVSSAVKSLSGEADAGGMGLLLPAVLVASSMFLVLVALRRRRAA